MAVLPGGPVTPPKPPPSGGAAGEVEYLRRIQDANEAAAKQRAAARQQIVNAFNSAFDVLPDAIQKQVQEKVKKAPLEKGVLTPLLLGFGVGAFNQGKAGFLRALPTNIAGGTTFFSLLAPTPLNSIESGQEARLAEQRAQLEEIIPTVVQPVWLADP